MPPLHFGVDLFMEQLSTSAILPANWRAQKVAIWELFVQ